jgi:hypothetical protein
VKRVIHLLIVLLLAFGCARRDAAFQEWKQYLESTPSCAIDPQDAAALINRMWGEQKNHLAPSLWKRARGTNQEDAVAACSILGALVQTATWHETDQIKSLADEISAKTLLIQMNTMATNSLSARWQEIHRFNIASVKQVLEQ